MPATYSYQKATHKQKNSFLRIDLMTLKTEQYFDEKAFSTLLKSDDASLLYPLFERALDSLTRFVKEPIKDY